MEDEPDVKRSFGGVRHLNLASKTRAETRGHVTSFMECTSRSRLAELAHSRHTEYPQSLHLKIPDDVVPPLVSQRHDTQDNVASFAKANNF